jgi:hypothetical protein
MLERQRRVNAIVPGMRLGLATRALLGVALSAAAMRPARALECKPQTGVSPCLDSNSLWLTPGASYFYAIPSARVAAARHVGFGLAVQGQFGALELVVPSPDPDGRSAKVVDRIVEEDVLISAGLGSGLELAMTLPLISYQRGAGVAALGAQRAAPIDRTAVRDPRASLGYAIALGAGFGVKPLLRLTLPLGDRESYASAGSLGVAPALPLEWHRDRWVAAALVGARLRPAVDFGAARWGSQAEFAAGVSFDVLGRERLRLGLEGWVLPSLVEATSARAREAGIDTTLFPAEWLGSLRASPGPRDPWSLSVGAGGGLALSTQSVSGVHGRFLAPTSPSLRLLIELRYAPVTDEAAR